MKLRSQDVLLLAEAQEEEDQSDSAASSDEVLLGVLGHCRIELNPQSKFGGVSAVLCAPCYSDNLAKVFYY